MQSRLTSTEAKPVDSPASPSGKSGDQLHDAVSLELDHILASSEFRQSEQSKRLLRYLVEHSLSHNEHLLKERAIGSALFNLEKGYDTNEHPIVRVRMNEIRKRLAKYYSENACTGVHFELPLGGYHVEFRDEPSTTAKSMESAGPKASDARHPAPWKYCWLALLVPVAGVMWFARGTDVVDQFWQPALHTSAPVIICTGNPVVYGFTRAFKEKLQGEPLDDFRAQTEILKPDPDLPILGRDIVPIPNQYVGLGTAYAVAQIDAWLAARHKEAEVRFGNDLSFTDLRKAPAVLIGAFQNRWTLQFSRGYRFVFESVSKKAVVRDAQTGKLWSIEHMGPDGQTDEDYVVISRVFSSDSGQFVVTAAGITQYGCRTAGEILTSSNLLAQALTQVKPDWDKHNLQLLYHVKIYGSTPAPPGLVALHQW